MAEENPSKRWTSAARCKPFGARLLEFLRLTHTVLVLKELSWKGNKHRSSSSTNGDFHRCVKDAISVGLWHPSTDHLRQNTQDQPLQRGPSWGSIKVFPLHMSQVVVLTSVENFLLTRHFSKETGLGWHTPKYNV